MSQGIQLDMEFGNFLRDFRRKSKMTQKSFSCRIGVTKQTLLKWENSRSFPSRRVLLRKLATSLRIPFGELFKIKRARQLEYRQKLIFQCKDPVISTFD